MRKIASLLSVLMLLCTLAFAQTRTVTGTIRDEKGDPIPFATITEAGTQNATTADGSGNFTISVRQNASLAVSASDFQGKTFPLTAGAQTFALTRGADLAEVVVTTALGIRRQAKELGYSTARVNN